MVWKVGRLRFLLPPSHSLSVCRIWQRASWLNANPICRIISWNKRGTNVEQTTLRARRLAVDNIVSPQVLLLCETE